MVKAEATTGCRGFELLFGQCYSFPTVLPLAALPRIPNWEEQPYVQVTAVVLWMRPSAGQLWLCLGDLEEHRSFFLNRGKQIATRER